MKKIILILALPCLFIGCRSFSKREVLASSSHLASSSLVPTESKKIIELLDGLAATNEIKASPISGIISCKSFSKDEKTTCFLQRETKANTFSAAQMLNGNDYPNLLEMLQKPQSNEANLLFADILCYRNSKDEAPFGKGFQDCAVSSPRQSKTYLLEKTLASDFARFLVGAKPFAQSGLQQSKGSVLCTRKLDIYECQLRTLAVADSANILILETEQNKEYTPILERALTIGKMQSVLSTTFVPFSLETFPSQLISEIECFVDNELFHKGNQDYAFCQGRIF